MNIRKTTILFLGIIVLQVTFANELKANALASASGLQADKVLKVIEQLGPEGKAKLMKMASNCIAKKGPSKFLEVLFQKEGKKRLFQYALGQPGPLPQFPKLNYTISRRIPRISGWINLVILVDILIHQEPYNPRNPIARYRKTKLALTGENLLDLEAEFDKRIEKKEAELMLAMKRMVGKSTNSVLPETQELESEIEILKNNPPNNALRNYIKSLSIAEIEEIVLGGDINILGKLDKGYRMLVILLFSDDFWEKVERIPDTKYRNQVKKILSKYEM